MGFFCKTVVSKIQDEAAAVAEIRQQLDLDGLKTILFFVSSDYNRQALGDALNASFTAPVFGCSAAGVIGPEGYLQQGLQVTAFYGSSLAVQLEILTPLSQCQTKASEIGRKVDASSLENEFQRFGLLLVDGLSCMEERLVAALHHCLPGVSLIGGSAGDNLAFQSAYVFANGRFFSDGAVLALIKTDVPFTAFKFQHFVPLKELLVVTAADAETRTVHEFNGEPAALVYGRYLGVEVRDLVPDIYSRNPVMLKIGTDFYVRSIQRCNDDLSLTFYCAIAKGIVLRLGEAVSPVDAAERAFENVRKLIPNPSLIIGFDCILRRLEFEQTGLYGQMGKVLVKNKVVGFSTYGEQFNGLHMNQTFTGLAVGGSS